MARNLKVPATLTPTDDRRGIDVKVYIPAIVLEILEVSWKSGIDTARNRVKITAPHWKVGEIIEEEDKADALHFKTGSQKPGVYLVKSKKGIDTFEVKVKITKNATPVIRGKLTGKLGTVSFEGDCALGVGVHTATMKFKNMPDAITHLEGDANWQLMALNQSIPVITKTRLELFVVFDKPMSFYTVGVWVEALRLVFKKAKVADCNAPKQAAARVTTYCHTGHGMHYDTVTGAATFFSGKSGTGAGYLQLWNYMQKTPSAQVNCYDQAAAVQSFAGALGIKTIWHYLSPFGYINKTNLVGVGPCNNPFFSYNNSTPLVATDSPKRSPFGNHAFVSLNQNIFDSCAGPHIGTEKVYKYLEVSIDASRPTLPANSTIAPYKNLAHCLASVYLTTEAGITGVQ